MTIEELAQLVVMVAFAAVVAVCLIFGVKEWLQMRAENLRKRKPFDPDDTLDGNDEDE